MPFSVGDKLGPYELLAPVGAGGMGEVWKARDTRLGRIVAIKQIKAHGARFEQEARAVAALNHPHICQIHDLGPDYLVLEYVEGAALQGPMGVEQALPLAQQIAGALEAAHRRGILHRDLKPANVIVTESGAKLLDFGLAKLTEDPGFEVTKTVEGAVLGTAAYMSPEQAQGQPTDVRSDIFSFGAVLYEMLTGRRAFSGESMLETLNAVVRKDPPALDSSLSSIVKRCLAKDPSQRFQTAAELRTALANPAQSVESREPSIAVLPFTNMSRDADDEFFGDGLAEEILNALARVDGLKVAARSSTFSFKGKGAELNEIASKLRVSMVLEGSVRRAGNRIRVTVQLVDVHQGFHLWSDRYDRQMEDIFEVQDEIARAIAEKLKLTLTGGVKQATANVEAYELYLKGRHYWHQRSGTSLRLAIRCFEAAIKLDPNYALAYAGLADCYGILRVYGYVSWEEGQPPAHRAVTQALKLAPQLWEVSFSWGFYQLYFENGWRSAESGFRKAAKINPRSSLAQAYLGMFLAAAGKEDEARAAARAAKELDPLSPLVQILTSCVFSAMGRFEEAVAAAQRALELQPDYLIASWLAGIALLGAGRYDEGVARMERAVSLSPAPIFVGTLGLGYALAGRQADGRKRLLELQDRAASGEYVPAFAPLAVYVGLGDRSSIRSELARAVEERTAQLTFSYSSGPFLQRYRDDPEIDRLLREVYQED